MDADVATEQPTREDILDAIRFHNTTAKALRRKGYIGTAGQSYVRIHALIYGLLTELEATP